ncbi:hypothetical protein IJJ12_02560 [bacterium]|nr:hypothetical protein [bacterium]
MTIEVLDWRRTGLRADREAALRDAVCKACLQRYPTSFDGHHQRNQLSMEDLLQAVAKTVARYQRTPWPW